jgi:hypothetical protein
VRRPRRATPNLWPAAFLLLSLPLASAAHAAGQTAFVDGGSVPVAPSGQTTLATLPTTFPAGSNFVIAVVQFETSVITTLTQGSFWVRRVGSVPIMSNFYEVRLSTGIMAQRMSYVLMGIETFSVASPTYVVEVNGTLATGVTGEAKILAVAGVTGEQYISPLDVDVGTAETTLTTLSTSLPAGDNVVLAVVETADTGNSNYGLSYIRLNDAAGGTMLAQNEYPTYYAQSAYSEYDQVHLIPYLDVGRGANPSYSVTAAESAGGSKMKGLAKIVAFSRGALSAAYSDGPSTSVGTAETTVDTLSTTLAAGSEVAVIASQQFAAAVFATRVVPAGLLKLQQNDDAGTQTSNEYDLNIREGDPTPMGGHGKGFALLDRFTSTPANPQYEVKATSSDVSLNVEAKILALAAAGSTEVELSSFTARGEDSAVSLEWQTASELDNLGFHLYRAASEGGPYQKITSSLIPGLGSSPVGARYSYTDTGLTNGLRYYYQLEDVETTGRTERHGPVSAIPVAGPTPGEPGEDPGTDPGGGDSTPAESTRVTYGDPSRVSLLVLRRDSTGVDLELTTGGFYATPEADGSIGLEIPGFELQGEPGTPSIPVERTFLEAVAGRQVRIASVVPSDVLSFPWSRPALAGAPELLVGRDGTPQAGFRRVRPAWVSRHPYPADPARVVTTAFQGETKKALLELAPLRWNPSTGQLLLTRRLRVRVAFDGTAPSETPLGGSRGRALPRQGARGSRAAQGLVAHLLARDEGLYAVAFEDAFRYRLRAVPTRRLRLSRLGQDVPFHVEPDPSRFAPGSVLYFLSEGGSLSAYTNEAVYELSVGTSGTAMTVVSSPPAGEALTEAVAHRSWEQNRYYMSGLLEAPDLWLWDSVLSGTAPKRYTFRPSSLAQSSAPATLGVWLQGASDLETTPDHHVRLSVNGSFVAEASWDGKTARRVEALLYPGTLHDGDNVLEIENVADTPAAYSMVYLDRFALDYPRALTAEAGRFEATFASSGNATLAGLGAGSRVLDTASAAPRWVVGAAAGPAGIAFGVEAGRRYLAVSPEAVLRPGIRWPSIASSDLRRTENQADYLLLAPRELLPAVSPLLQLRAEQGLRPRAVALDEVYDAFGHGEKSPEAIREFVAYAYHRWAPPSPRYVVLLGDSTFDPKDYAGTGVKDHLPAFMFRSTWLWTASDPAYASVNGDDSLPDLAVGRLPASSLEQAQRLVQKLLSFERNEFDPSAGAVLVADNPDRAGDFEADVDDIASGPLAGFPTEKISLGRLGTEATRSAIVAAFDRGASLMSYVGHGAPAVWASEGVLTSWDVDGLSPQARQPILFTMNCLNGYFLAPAFDSLAEALVKAEDKGAIAAFSPSGLSLDAAARVYHEALVRRVVSGRHERLGDAILAAQGDYAASGAFPELLSVYNLFGDPATRLR